MNPDSTHSEHSFTQGGPLARQLLQQLQGAPFQRIAGELGIGAEQVHGAAAVAIPLLLGAMGHNAQRPEKAQELLGALQRDHMPAQASAEGLDWGALAGSLLGGASGAGDGTGDGAAILGHILGGKREQAEEGLEQVTGLGSQAAPLLRMLAPLVMAYLAQRVRAGSLGASDLGGVLEQENAQARTSGSAAGGLLTHVLDRDGDGRVDLGDLVKMGAGLFGGRQ